MSGPKNLEVYHIFSIDNKVFRPIKYNFVLRDVDLHVVWMFPKRQNFFTKRLRMKHRVSRAAGGRARRVLTRARAHGEELAGEVVGVRGDGDGVGRAGLQAAQQRAHGARGAGRGRGRADVLRAAARRLVLGPPAQRVPLHAALGHRPLQRQVARVHQRRHVGHRVGPWKSRDVTRPRPSVRSLDLPTLRRIHARIVKWTISYKKENHYLSFR